MKLSDWMAREKLERGLTYRKASKLFDIDPANLNRLANGLRLPSWPQMETILRVTRGLVAPNDFVRKCPKGAKI